MPSCSSYMRPSDLPILDVRGRKLGRKPKACRSAVLLFLPLLRCHVFWSRLLLILLLQASYSRSRCLSQGLTMSPFYFLYFFSFAVLKTKCLQLGHSAFPCTLTLPCPSLQVKVTIYLISSKSFSGNHKKGLQQHRHVFRCTFDFRATMSRVKICILFFLGNTLGRNTSWTFLIPQKRFVFGCQESSLIIAQIIPREQAEIFVLSTL